MDLIGDISTLAQFQRIIKVQSDFRPRLHLRKKLSICLVKYVSSARDKAKIQKKTESWKIDYETEDGPCIQQFLSSFKWRSQWSFY